MNRLHWTYCLALLASACSGDDGTSDTADESDAPAALVLGPMIDRVGRPGVAEALLEPFGDATLHHMIVSSGYSLDDPERWPAALSAPIARSLAVYDALDGVCGNQLLAAGDGPDRYDALANLLADDRLWIDTRVGTCRRYLAVEAEAAGLAAADDCGGRTPEMDVIDTTYSFLATGMPDGVTDGIAADPDGAPSTDFPFVRPAAN